MNILVAPDSFKGSLSALQFCQITAQQIQQLCPDVNLQLQPMADGGEGTIDAILQNTAGRRVSVKVCDPLGRLIDSHYAILEQQHTAVIEMAQASGLPLIESRLREPLKASSYGTGELIRHALDQGCRRIIMGLGGSATNDGGIGMLQALGVSFLDTYKRELKSDGAALQHIARIDLSLFEPRIASCEFIIAADVINPLLGENGATMTYGRQKGATPQALKLLEAGMQNYAEKTLSTVTDMEDFTDYPGAGAAGGMGFALLTFCRAAMHSGFEVIARLSGLSDLLSAPEYRSDLLITGEGCLDRQSLSGKLPGRLIRYAEQADIPLVILCGSTGDDLDKDKLSHNVSVYSIQNDLPEVNISIQQSMKNADTLLAKLIVHNAHKFLLTS